MSSITVATIFRISWLKRHTLLMVAVLLGALVRLTFVSHADFPLNDGGLFYAMTRELQVNSFRLPLFTAYNGASIPFAYPPLAFYLAAWLSSLAHWDLVSVFTWFPFLVNLLCIPAFYALAVVILPEEPISGLATLLFALLPRSFQWLIMGGGLTRSIGFLFALLAIRFIYLLFRYRQQRHLLLAILFSGLTVVSHLEMAWFVAYTTALFIIFYLRDWQGLRNAILLAAGAALLALPWWGTILHYHGITPFLSASAHGWPWYSGILGFLVQGPTLEAFIPIVGLLALLGCIQCIIMSDLLLPIWLAVMFVLDPRSAYTTATAPLALLAAIGVVQVLAPLVAGLLPRQTTSMSENIEGQVARSTAVRRAAFCAIVAIAGYLFISTTVGQARLLTPLPATEREAMAWVASNTPSDAAFVTVPAEFWPADRSGEWFPVLANRISVSTVQGSEWISGDRLAVRIDRHLELQRCITAGSACLDRWLSSSGGTSAYVYLPKRTSATATIWSAQSGDCCRALTSSLANDRRYTLVYDGPGAAIFRRN